MYLKPLSIADGANLIKNLVNIYTPESTIDLEMAMYASTKVNGHPYYLYCLVTSKYPSKIFDDEKAIDSILDYEIRKGKIYGFWQTHFEENRENINNDNDKEIGKKILYYFTKYSDKEVDIAEIAKAINVSEAEVEKKIEKLYYADIVHKEENRFRGFQDICLMRYIQNVYSSDIKGVPVIDLSEKGLHNFIKGKYFELLMANAMNMFNREEIVLGHCGQKKTIKAPKMRTAIGYQFKEDTSSAYEIDIVGRIHEPSMMNSLWLCECKYRKAKMGIEEVKKLEEVQKAYVKHAKVLAEFTKDVPITRWYISTAGFTKEALEYMKSKEDVYYSDYEEANKICKQYGAGYDLPVEG
jgi:DNA-binding transcriptional ArsR family regulator